MKSSLVFAKRLSLQASKKKNDNANASKKVRNRARTPRPAYWNRDKLSVKRTLAIDSSKGLKIWTGGLAKGLELPSDFKRKVTARKELHAYKPCELIWSECENQEERAFLVFSLIFLAFTSFCLCLSGFLLVLICAIKTGQSFAHVDIGLDFCLNFFSDWQLLAKFNLNFKN